MRIGDRAHVRGASVSLFVRVCVVTCTSGRTQPARRADGREKEEEVAEEEEEEKEKRRLKQADGEKKSWRIGGTNINNNNNNNGNSIGNSDALHRGEYGPVRARF